MTTFGRGRVLRALPTDRHTDAAILREIARSASSDNETVMAAAWKLLNGHVPVDVAETFQRGGFLDTSLSLCEKQFGQRLYGWTIEYMSTGRPYDATLHLRMPDETLTGRSDLSAAAAVVLALLRRA